MAGAAPDNGGRVTTREFYDAQLETNAKIEALATDQSNERHAMELRIISKLDPIITVLPQVGTNKDEIKRLRDSSNVKDWVVLLVGIVGNAIAATIGSRQ